jgi:hypothetical protein
MLNIDVRIRGVTLDYRLGERLAEAAISNITGERLLVAWYDGIKGEEHPHVPEYQHKGGWLAYAEDHGGDTKVTLNDERFVFIFSHPG